MSADDMTPSEPPTSEVSGAETPPGDGITRREGLSTGAKIGIGAGAAVVVGGGAVVAAALSGAFNTGIRITVNGQAHTVSADPSTPLLYVLRDEIGLRGLRFGCGFGQCGACAVQVDNVKGRAIRSCQTKVSSVDGRSITTLEGLGTIDKPSKLQQAFIDQQAAQCGYCTAGMIIEADAYLKSNPSPSRADIKSAMATHLCRCGTHYRILRAIQQASGTLPSASVPVTTLYDETQGA